MISLRAVCSLVVIAVAWGLTPPSARAQDADFLFKTPRVTFSLLGGVALPQESSDIFDITRDEFTVDQGAFNSFAFGLALAYRVTEQLDVGLDFGYTKKSVDSESRDFIGSDDLPILQTTELERVPFSLNAKYYLSPRGRSISRFAWIPEGFAPYVGVGGGVMPYEFHQFGEFVDFNTLEIFFDDFVSEGAAPLFQVLGGADINVSPRVALVVDGRYTWASAPMDELGRDADGVFEIFEGFDDIDLSGFQLSAGLRLRF